MIAHEAEQPLGPSAICTRRRAFALFSSFSAGNPEGDRAATSGDLSRPSRKSHPPDDFRQRTTSRDRIGIRNRYGTHFNFATQADRSADTSREPPPPSI